MKKRIISFFTALSMTLMLFTGIPIGVSAAGNIAINETNFPDEKFREYISKNIDTDSNGSLSSDEIANTTEITITGVVIYNLKGIEFFTELTSLNVQCKSLTTLNISKNTKLAYLSCAHSGLTELDVSKNTALTYLDCNDNHISELDVSKNIALIHLDCSFNALTELDVSKNVALTSLACGGSNNGSGNKFTELDVSKNIRLTYLSCGFTSLPELDVSKNIELTELACLSNSFNTLDISNNTKLTTLLCGNNNLTELDLSKNTELTQLSCYGNQLTKLDVSNNTNLTKLNCQNNKIEELDLSANTALEGLMCFNNQLASVDVSKSTSEQMQPFNCRNNKHTVSTCVLDNNTLPAGFDLSKASDWSDNVEVTNDKVLYKGTGDVTYTYDCGQGNTATFTLVFPPRDLTKVEAKDATCTENGNIEYYKCSCGYKFKNENPAAADILSDEDVVTAATGHTLTAHDAVPADCTTDGNETYWTCSVCNKMFSDENGTTEITEIPTIPAGHKYSEDWESGDNEHWHECTVCHNKKDIGSHVWNTGIVTKPATEDTEGEKTYTCTVCSATKTESLDKLTHTHTLTSHAAVPATCTTDGNKAYWTCSGCNKMFSDENGTTEIDSIPVIPAAGHKYEWKSDANEHWHECTVCGDKKDNASHIWNDGIVTTEPDEDTEGEKTYTCTICSATKTESIGKTEHKHTLTVHDAVPADCTTNGNEAYWTCSGCDKMFLDENGTREITAIPTISATGHKFLTEWASDETYHWHAATCGHDVVSDKAVHSWDSGIVTTEPTEEAAGVKTFTCSDCSATKTESIPKLTHTHTLTAHDAVPADCTTKGNEAYWTCSGCNKMFSDENGTMEITAIPTIPSTGHAYSTDWTSDSTSHWHAATCGHDVTSEAAAHTEDGGTVTVPATAENDGVKTYACSVCGYVMRTVTIPKLGEDHNHSFSPDWKHDSTSHWHECDCGEKNEIAPHVENGGVVTTEPTETSTGIMTYSCETCGYVMRTDVIPARVPEHNHNFGTDWKYDSVSHWHECECGEKSDIANHISSDWIVVTPATTDLEGVQIKRCTVCGIELDRETIEKLPNISTGDVAEDVRDTAGTNAGLVQDNTLIENTLTPQDKTEVTEGHSFEIVLEVTDIRDSVPAADVTAASSSLKSDEKIGIYVDLSLFKIKDNSERTPIYNTSGRIGITLTIPESIYASDRTYSIIRVHDGIAENLGGTYDKVSRELTFYTDKFSTYAIAYAASNSGTDRPTVPDTPTNPSVQTYPNTPVMPVTPTVTETTVKKEEEVISDEPYVEDVSSAAGIYESGETDSNIHYVMILIFAAAAGIAVIVAKKHFCKKNMK